MCGIVGAIAERDIVPVLIEGLRRLEYRGYDSAGVAVVDVNLATGVSLEALADYIALVMLAPMRLPPDAPGVPSVLSLFDGSTRPTGLSVWDRAFLKGLYAMQMNRSAQRQRQQFTRSGLPIISVDTKKKELVGPFKNAGRIWSQEALPVNDHDFRSQAKGIAIDFGIVDRRHHFLSRELSLHQDQIAP